MAKNWSKLQHDERQREEVTDKDLLEMATAIFNIHNADSCADYLRGWSPREVSYRVGRTLSNRFIDHGRYHDLNDLAAAAENDLCLILAITLELRKVYRDPPKSVVERTLRLVLNSRIKLNDSNRLDIEGNTIQALTALVEASHKLSVGQTDELIALLTRYLPSSPPKGLSSRYSSLRFPLLRAYALKAALSDQPLNLIDLAHKKLRKELECLKPHSESHDVQEFKGEIGAILPWHRLWAKIFVDRTSSANLANAIAETKAESAEASRVSYRDETSTSDEIAQIWFDTLLISENADAAMFDDFDQWIVSLKKPLLTKTLTRLARRAARSDSVKARALDYAGWALDLIRNERESAESKSEGYVDLARAVLLVSRSEAAVYFNLAVEVAGKIGEENLDRWGALLDLANSAAFRDRPKPELAYRLARCAELTYDYVARDKYFYWEDTVEAISGLCGKSSLAIISRWRDRDFGWAERILPIAVNFLVTRGDLDPHEALALIGFRAQWNVPLLLKNVLAVSPNNAEKEVATAFAYRYMTLGRESVKTWCKLKAVVANHDLILSGLDDRIASREQEEQSGKPEDGSNEIDSGAVKKNKRDWDAIFEGIDFSLANDISRAKRRYKDYEPPYYYKQFFEEACRRVRVGKEAEFVIAIANVVDFDFYHLRNFLEQLPKKWKSRLAVKPALDRTMKTFCRRFCMEITTSRNMKIYHLKAACDLSGIFENDLVDEILESVGEATEVVGASRLFTLVGLLALKLTENEALEALSFGLDLFDPIIEDADGDGRWSPKLEPPAEIACSVAGYIWSCLAAPQASLRWEAAHVIRALCTLGNKKVLKHLIKLANGASADAFFDSHLTFYKLHACQWLLIGLARAAKDHPDLIAPHADFLIGRAFTDEPHVLMQEFAKRTILTLLDAGLLDSHYDLRQRLSVVNTSTLPSVESKILHRYENGGTDAEDKASADGRKDKIYFGHNLGSYWFSPLGECFAKSNVSIEREVLRVIRDDWQRNESDLRNDDERHRRNIFKDMETYHSQGQYPHVDDLHFYLSYHAMMVVAGKLLATTPVQNDPDYSGNGFRNWLRLHDLSRQDGGWLADRRDPAPLARPKWENEKEKDEWRWSLAKEDFDRILLTAGDRLNLWGHWTRISGRREESIRVTSALVSPDRSTALLRALQSVDNPFDYRLPDADDDLQINYNGYQLKGWIVDQPRDSGLDENDPWSGAISYPPPMPAAYITKLMGLKSDAEDRRWYVQENGTDVAWSRVWGYFNKKDHEEKNRENGTRLQASFAFTVSTLSKQKMDLIIEVKIERRHRYSSWERNNKDDIGFTQPSVRLFLIRADGSIRTL